MTGIGDATERFDDVFSKLRAGCVALGGGAEGAPVRPSPREVWALFFGNRWLMKSVETRTILDTLPEGPEIHPGHDFGAGLVADVGAGTTCLFRPGLRTRA